MEAGHCPYNMSSSGSVRTAASTTGRNCCAWPNKSLAATGRVADGWLPGHAADWLSDRYRTSRPIIDEAAAAIGRDPQQIRTIFNFPGRITDRPLPAPRDHNGRWIGGSTAQWAEEIVPAVREAIAKEND
jgi:hypothetical protein